MLKWQMGVRNNNIGSTQSIYDPLNINYDASIGGPLSTQGWLKLTKVHVLEVQIHLLRVRVTVI